MFSIYSDRGFLASPSTPHTTILVPFWGTNPEQPGDPDNGRFDRYAEAGAWFLSLTALADCDVGVFPQNWESAGEQAFELGERFGAVCREAGKPPVYFTGADSAEPLPVEGLVFRTSVFRTQRRPNEFALPAWSEDLLGRYAGGELQPRAKQARPVIGFCGNTMVGLPVETPSFKLGRRGSRRTRGLSGNHPRTLALQAIEHDRRLRSSFVLRGEFWGHLELTCRVQARREYVQNTLNSDYVLCARGVGNFSYRLYETLSLGRIPVFVNTDSVLPLEFEIDWRDYCVWVNESDIEHIGDRVLEFHEALDDGEFAERQRACRRLWETHISPQGFFAHFADHFSR